MKKLRHIMVFLLILLLIGIMGGYMYYKNIKTSHERFINLSQNLSQHSKSFISSLNQLKGKDLSDQYCFELTGGEGKSTVDCFVPNEIEEHLSGFENIDDYKNKIKESRMLDGVKELSYLQKDKFLQFFDTIQPSFQYVGSGYINIKQDLQNKIESKRYSKDEGTQYLYILSLEGDYEKYESFRKDLCKKFNKFCDNEIIEFTISGKVTLADGSPLEGTNVRLLGSEFMTKTDKDGNYKLDFKTFPNSKIRIQAHKPGFSLGNFPLNILSPEKKQSNHKDFILNSPAQTANINTITNTIEGTGTSIQEKNFIIKTDWSEYKIPFNSIMDKSGKHFKGKLTAYMFEFNKQSKIDDLLKNDIFDNVAGYAGNIMKTFGMPFILLISEQGDTLFIYQSNPMVLTNKIQEMQALRTNHDKVYQPLTDDDMKMLVQKTNELGGYPIDRIFLFKNNILRFPAFWVFDINKGTWVNVGVKVLSIDGMIQLEYYNFSDKK